MNFAERAKQLQEQRLERERVHEAEERKARDEAARSAQQSRESAYREISPLVNTFRQFDGFKIFGGRVIVEACQEDVDGQPAVCLTATSRSSPGVRECPPGTQVIYAHYLPATAEYQLGYLVPNSGDLVRRRLVGGFKSVDELMNAVVEQIANF
jgi:regulator of protease activity HflC (stomatin/prohibitin superfamily)